MKLRDWLLDLFFPQVRCMVCGGTEGMQSGVCASCRDKMERYPLKDVCPVCGRAMQEAEKCPACGIHTPSYTAARAGYMYDGETRKLIHCMKFKGEYDLPVRLFAQTLGEMLDELGWTVDCVTAVPSTPESLRKRGYNQAKKLAERLCRLKGLRMATELIRKKRGTQSQVGRNAENRRENLRGAILPGRKSTRAEGKRVLLIDDVYTTGSTVEACAQALKKCGAKEVYVLCIARVPEKSLEQYLAGKME